MALITIIAVVLATETHREDINADRGAERRLIAESGGETAGPPQPRVQ
jgi:hypothetical protein